ncbi:Crp/Fnr family transcriptional regulator [Micromonospora sonneratiae]|uniref:Crp/Fnr family transcriptional regulator n=1 Tax=Micromonospora sonneratiae TaxID=1184706 RepID=A0ABW3YBL3_9ACTN
MSVSDNRKESKHSRWPPNSFVGRLGPIEQNALLRLGGREEFRDSRRLLRQGDRGRNLLLLTSGNVEVVATAAGRRPRRLGLRTTGDLVGEISYLDSQPRSASVIAIGTVTALNISYKAFDLFLAQHPAAHRPFARILADRLRAADVRPVESGQRVEIRVAAALCELDTTTRSDGTAVVLITQRELARLVGASQISTHRALRKFSDQGYITTGHRSIAIRDIDGLIRCAQRLPPYIT